MINFDSIVKAFGENEMEHKNINAFFPQHPFRCIIIGPSNSGKTNDLLNVIHNSLFNKLYIYSKCLDENKYQFLIKLQEEKERYIENKEKLIFYSSEISDVIPLEKLDKTFQHLYIFDDMCLESSAQQEQHIGDLYIRSRKYNCSVIYLSQSYFKIPKVIRNQATFVVIKKLTDERELKIIRNIYASDIPNRNFINKYNDAVSTYNNHGSFIIDNAIKHDSLKLRANYIGIFV